MRNAGLLMNSVSESTATRTSSKMVDLLRHVECRLATTEQDRREIYNLRYRAYLKEGAITPNAAQLTTDRYDLLPNSWIFGVYYDGQLASSLRISVASPEHPETPSLKVFPDFMEHELANGKIIVDPTRFVAEPTLANRWVELPYMTLRLAFVACEYFGADIGFASVRAEHQAFYRRVMMHAIAPPRDYPGLTKPIGLMAIEFPKMRDKLFERYPFLRSSLSEQRKLFGRPGKPRVDFDRHAMSLREATIAPRA